MPNVTTVIERGATEHERKTWRVLFLKGERNKPRNWWEDNINMSDLETGRNFLITE